VPEQYLKQHALLYARRRISLQCCPTDWMKHALPWGISTACGTLGFFTGLAVVEPVAAAESCERMMVCRANVEHKTGECELNAPYLIEQRQGQKVNHVKFRRGTWRVPLDVGGRDFDSASGNKLIATPSGSRSSCREGAERRVWAARSRPRNAREESCPSADD